MNMRDLINRKLGYLLFFVFLAQFMFFTLEAVAEEQSTASTLAESAFETAVLDFQSTEESLKDFSPKVNALLSAYLSTKPELALVERSELDKALSEQELGITGTVDANTAAQIGYLTGAKVLVTGRIFSVDNQVFLVAKIIGTETGRVFGETETTLRHESPAPAAEKLATKIAETVKTRGSSLVAQVEKPEDIVGKLKALAQGKTLPTVSVKIDERSIGAASIDPAAETELSLILQQVGFPLVDREKTETPPDIEITGEAFSEFGMRKGNLVSSKGRLEVKAVERSSGRVLGIDRQTEAGVDLSQEIAGKTALQAAARKLAVRIVPKLIK